MKPRIRVSQAPDMHGLYGWLVTGEQWSVAGTGRTPDEAHRLALREVAEHGRQAAGAAPAAAPGMWRQPMEEVDG